MLIAKKNSKKFNYCAIWLSLFILIAFQYYLFKQYFQHEVLGFYPINFDQGVFLSLTYELFGSIKSGNIISSFSHMTSTLPTGMLFPVNALVSFFMTEPSRFSALLPNLFYFSLLQIISFWTIKNITGKTYLGFIFVGLLLTLKTPFSAAGGIADFRMDFIAFCMYGIFIATVMKSNVFLHRRWTFIVASVAILMILLRCITAVYFGMTIGALIFYFSCICLFSTNQEQVYEGKKRFINLALAILLVCIIILPCIYINKESLYQYYVVGHLTGAEGPIRGLPRNDSWITHLLYYPVSVADQHIGAQGKHAIYLLIIAFSSFYLMARKFSWIADSSVRQANIIGKNKIIFLLCAIFFPLMILTLDQSKSPVVGNIVVTPILWLVILFSSYLDRKIEPTHKFLPTACQLLAILILVWGITNQWHLFHFKKKHHQEQLQDFNTISKMYLDIGDYATAKKWSHITFCNDKIIDSITYCCLRTVYFENRGKLLNVQNELLGATIFAIPKKSALQSINHSNVVILTLKSENTDPGPYPFEHQVATYRSALIRYADQHFNKLGDYTFQGNQFRVYVKG